MMQLDDVALIAQKCLETTPVTLVLGSGASIPHGLPSMTDLADHIRCDVSQRVEDKEEEAWDAFTDSLDESNDFEEALHLVDIPDSLLNKIVVSTWKRIASDDRRVYEKVRSGGDLALAKLLQFLCMTASRKLHIVTTNYDRLAEYAVELSGEQAWTGFSRGYLQSWVGCDEASFHGCNITLLKVHGSLDWFHNGAGAVPIGVPLALQIPEGTIPHIVTPGVAKYRTTHRDPFRSILSKADAVLENTGCFICVGYGFNDAHVHPRLLARLRSRGANLILLAKELTPAAQENLLKEPPPRKFLFLEKAGTNTRVYHRDTIDGEVVNHPDLWSTSGLTYLLTGNSE